MCHAGSIFRKACRTDQKYQFPDWSWICNRDEYLDIEPDADVNQIEEDSLDEESNRTVHSIMKTFNLTWKEALEEFITYTYKAGDTEGGAIWL